MVSGLPRDRHNSAADKTAPATNITTDRRWWNRPTSVSTQASIERLMRRASSCGAHDGFKGHALQLEVRAR
jgi:hypothetical protein